MKYCPKCQTEKPFSAFSTAKRRDGYQSWCKACNSEYATNRVKELRELVFDKLGHVCCRCGFSDKRALQIDHVYGGGNQEHATISSTRAFIDKVLADTEGTYQILCANCNWIKRAERLEVNRVSKLTEAGRAAIVASRTGATVTEITRARMSESATGKVKSERTRKILSITTKAGWDDPEIRRKRIEGQANRPPITDETKKLMSIRASEREAKFKELGINPKKKWSEETRQKMQKIFEERRKAKEAKNAA